MIAAHTPHLPLFNAPSFGKYPMTDSHLPSPVDPSDRTSKPNAPLASERKLPSIEELLSAAPPVLPDPRPTKPYNSASIIPPSDRYPGTTHSYSHPVSALPPLSAGPQPLTPLSATPNPVSSHLYSTPSQSPALLAGLRSSPPEGYPFRPATHPPLIDHHDAPLQSRSTNWLPGVLPPNPESRPASRGGMTVSTPVRKLVGEETIPGQGPCWLYEDGTYVRKEIDGEPVNAQWGITKAGKPRKRLAMACKTCREKKIKCEPAEPKCSQCERSGRICHYETARNARRP